MVGPAVALICFFLSQKPGAYYRSDQLTTQKKREFRKVPSVKVERAGGPPYRDTHAHTQEKGKKDIKKEEKEQVDRESKRKTDR